MFQDFHFKLVTLPWVEPHVLAFVYIFKVQLGQAVSLLLRWILKSGHSADENMFFWRISKTLACQKCFLHWRTLLYKTVYLGIHRGDYTTRWFYSISFYGIRNDVSWKVNLLVDRCQEAKGKDKSGFSSCQADCANLEEML